VSVQRKELRIGEHRRSAILVPCVDGFRALVDTSLWEAARASDRGRRRMRFVVAHELGHTFFYAEGDPPRRTSAPGRTEEAFCHRFASALLVPPKAAMEASLDPRGLFALSSQYDVSARVAAMAIAAARPDVTLLWLRHAPHPHRGGEETMRVQWGAGSRFIASGESLKSELAALAPGETGEVVEELRLSGRTEVSNVAAWRFGSSMLAIVRRTGSSPTTYEQCQRALF